MVISNLTNLTSISTFYGLVEYSNRITDGFLISGTIVSVFIILIFTFLNEQGDIMKSVLVSSFLCTILSIIFSSIRLLDAGLVIMFIVLTIVSWGIVWFSNKRN